MKRIFIIVFFSIFISGCTTTFIFQDMKPQNSHYLRYDPHNSTVIIFVHGVLGDSTTTWMNSNDSYWPELIKNDSAYDNANIYLIEYPSPVFDKSYSIDELADYMRRDLDSDKVLDHSKLIFLSHSMGGLVTRAFLIKYRQYSDKVFFLYFFATPTSGSPTASIAKIASKNPQLGSMKPVSSDAYLADVQRNWLASEQLVTIPSYCAYEMRDTHGIRIVDQQSAIQLCNRPVDPIDKNHFDIVKPTNVDDISYKSFKAAYIRETEKIPPKIAVKSKLIRHTDAELDQYFKEQVRFLCISLANFDRGEVSEYKRIAAILNTLFNNTDDAQSLLKQMRILDKILLPNTASGDMKGNLAPYMGLVVVKIGEGRITYLARSRSPMGGPVPESKIIHFGEWWRTIILDDHEGLVFTREALVIAIAEQGGNKVASGLDPSYFKLARETGIGWKLNNDRPFFGVEVHSMRQIGWEVLEAIKKQYPMYLPN